jgi:hypothetical protein
MKLFLGLWLLFAQTAPPVYLPRPQALYKTTKLSQSDVAVSCRNGAPPRVHDLGSFVVVGCEN